MTPRDRRAAARRGARDRRDHARQPLRRRALVRPRRPATARHARRQRERRAPVRPPRAGGHAAQRAPGAAPPPGLPRPAHRAWPTERCSPTRSRRRSQRDAGELAVLFIDLDDFKTVNDSLGHAAGDELLVSVASRLRACLRPEDLVARLGGDEFAVMVEDAHDVETAAVGVARRIMEAFAAPVGVGPESVVGPRSASGSPPATGARSAAEELIRDADVAMYKAKTSGKGPSRSSTPAWATAVLERHGLKEELRLAIERERADPLLPADRRPRHRRARRRGGARALGASAARPGRAVGVRAARRGDRADPVARPVRARGGLPAGARLGARAGQPRASHAAGGARQPLRGRAARPDARRARARDAAAHRRRSLAASCSRSPRRCCSTTQSASRPTLAELRALGVRFALDDFGTGYSSLSYLHTLPLDILKIAKSFVDGLARGGREASFVRMIIELARTLGVTVIAEGIETQEQVDALVALECDLRPGLPPRPPAPRRATSSRSASRPSASRDAVRRRTYVQ